MKRAGLRRYTTTELMAELVTRLSRPVRKRGMLHGSFVSEERARAKAFALAGARVEEVTVRGRPRWVVYS